MIEARPFLQRYLLRRDVVKKVKHRVMRAQRRMTRSELGDAARLLAHRHVDMVFDVGANIGYVADHLLRTYPSATLHAFEPTPDTFAALQRHLSHHGRAQLHHLAVSDQRGTVNLYQDNRTYGGGANSLLDHSPHFLASQPRARYRPIPIEATTLDAFCDEQAIDHIDLLKLDVEGSEVAALAGAGGLLGEGRVDVVATEIRLQPDFIGGPMMCDVFSALTAHRYRPFGIYEFAESQLGQARWANALFLSPTFRRELEGVHGSDACGFSD